MKQKKPAKNTLQRSILYVITLVFTFMTLNQSTTAAAAEFDKGFAARNDIEFYHPCGTDPNVDADSTSTPSEYIKLGSIPKEGLEVGASVFGGKQQGGKWVADLADNNGNDLGDHGNHLTGTTSFAELGIYPTGSVGDALGKLEPDSKLEITYNGKKIIAVKGDVGTGGENVKGKKRAVDLWWETANLLGFNVGTDVITIHAVDKNTPTTPLSGKPTADKSADNTADTGTCCNESQAGDGTLMGKTNEQKIWNFLTGRDGNIPMSDALSPEQAAGLMGNLKAESSYEPNKEEVGRKIGYGIAQWSYGRRTALEKAAKKQGVPVSDLAFQLKYLYQESKSRTKRDGGGKEWDGMRQQKTIEDAVFYWEYNFERSADSKERVVKNRGGFAKEAYKNGMKLGTGTTTAPATGGQVIFLDPGHGGNIPDYTDKKSGLVTNETNNGKEDKDVLEVANKVKTQLEKEGYKVEMARTKNNMSASETPKFRERADMAAKANASMGISIHTSPGGPNDAWSQRKSTKQLPIFRESRNGSHHTPFEAGDTATKSQAYAEAIAKARSKAEGHQVGQDINHAHQKASFGRGGNIKSPGNIPLVALFSPKVPWVYNEIEQDQGTGLSNKRKEAYAKGIVNGVIEALPPTASDCDSAADSTGLAGKTLAYAWPEHSDGHSPPKPPKRKAYDDAVKKARKEGRYVGNVQFGDAYVGVDCGGFVTTLLIDSGFEPKYNNSGKGGYTIIQEQWLRKNWKSLGTGANIKLGGKGGGGKTPLQPGDVAINNNHTFVYVGKVGKDPETGKEFETEIASASYAPNSGRWRAPMAGVDPATSSDYRWYRKK